MVNRKVARQGNCQGGAARLPCLWPNSIAAWCPNSEMPGDVANLGHVNEAGAGRCWVLCGAWAQQDCAPPSLPLCISIFSGWVCTAR